MHRTPHTSWPCPSKTWRHHGGTSFLAGFAFERRDFFREELLLDDFAEEDREVVFTVPTTLTAAPPATEDRGPVDQARGPWSRHEAS
jgi:hypothetical protein